MILVSEPVSHVLYVAQVAPAGQPPVKQTDPPPTCASTGCRAHRSKHARATMLKTALLRINENENGIVIFLLLWPLDSCSAEIPDSARVIGCDVLQISAGVSTDVGGRNEEAEADGQI